MATITTVRKSSKTPRRHRAKPSQESEEGPFQHDWRAAIAEMEGRLPDVRSALNLNQAFVTAQHTLLTYLHRWLTEEPVVSQFLICSLAESATHAATALRILADTNIDILKPVLIEAGKWPAVISIDPTEDIRKVNKNQDGRAAKAYATVLENLGTNCWPKPSKLKAPGIFHQIAVDAVTMISRRQAAEASRAAGLPGLFDFPDQADACRLPDGPPTKETAVHWGFAIKYFLHLTVAPEPFRTEFRNHWRERREEAFHKIHPAKAQRNKHRELCEFQPELEALDLVEIPLLEEKHDFYHVLHSPAIPPGFGSQPLWQRWWRANLRFHPQVLFGMKPSLIDWPKPEIQKLVKARLARNRPMTAFGRCVDAVLDSWFRLCGISDGRSRMQKILPKLRVTEFSFSEANAE